MGMRDLADELEARREKALAMGGADAIAKQHREGKLTVRERVDRLFDPGTFQEIGLLANHANISPAMKGRDAPADGVVTGFGKINGRPASLIAYDFTVMAGSMGRTAEVKCNRAREIALSKRMPMIWLIDSAGARIQEAIGSTFAGSGFLFREESIMSGVVPMVAAMMGPGAAGTAYIPALSDFVPMVKGTSHMALGGPPLVKAIVGEDITAEELGGSKIHTEVSGVADLEVADDAACIDAIKAYLSYFPSSNLEQPPIVACDDPADRMDEALLSIVPDSARRAYDMKKVIAAIVDRGQFFEIKPGWAKNLITSLARLGGRPVGIVANQPMVLGGALDVDSADKAAGYFVMCGKAYEPDLIVAWPTAEISVMGPEGGTNIIFRKEIAAAANPDQERARKVEEFRGLINPYIAAGGAFIDDVIDPRETRPVLIRALEMAATKKVDRPWKKHGVMPV